MSTTYLVVNNCLLLAHNTAVCDKVTNCRRMEDAVKAIPESSDMCKKIVLGHNVDDIPGKPEFNMFV